MNISMPDSLREYAEAKTARDDYASSSEYVRGLIRADRDRDQLRSLIDEGLASPSVQVLDDDYLQGLQDIVDGIGQ